MLHFLAMSLSISTVTQYDQLKKTGVLVIPVTSPAELLQEPLLKLLPVGVANELAKKCAQVEFKGAWASAELFLAPAGCDSAFVGVLGLGEKTLSAHKRAEGLRRALGKIMQDARRHMVRDAAVVLVARSDAPALTSAIVETALSANYRFVAHSQKKSKDQTARSLQKLTLLVQPTDQKEIKSVITSTQKIMAGVELTRNLVNEPASHASPARLVAEAKKVAKLSTTISLKVLDKKEAAKAGFSAFLAVAKGSSEQPYVIHLVYKPKKKTSQKIILVGKGITFDSGGLSLKPADYMMDMKIDMAGAATVLGLFSVLPDLNVSVEVHGIIATCENMPSGNAYRPGDVLTAKNGKTIEVLNTDAEGRLTLADALSYAVEQKPQAVIDLATLTGACVVATGETHAGLWSNNEQLREAIENAGNKAGEGLVVFPLPEEYKPSIVSKVADLQNISTSHYGGAITAALFLQEFVGETAWAHIDLAGPVYYASSILSYVGDGASGYGVRTLVEYLKAQ